MESKKSLRDSILIDRGLVRKEKEGNHVKGNKWELVKDVHKTPDMRFIEKALHKYIEEILLWNMSNRKLADHLTNSTGKYISHGTVCNWRKMHNISRVKV